MFKTLKLSLVCLTLFALTACANGNVFYSSKIHLAKSCNSLNREHTLLGRKVRGLMVSSLRARKSYSTARLVAKSYSNWPVYFIVDGNSEFNQKMSGYKAQYQKIRYAALQKKCSFFRDVLASNQYKAADSKY